jgi:hypothetical protein
VKRDKDICLNISRHPRIVTIEKRVYHIFFLLSVLESPFLPRAMRT